MSKYFYVTLCKHSLVKTYRFKKKILFSNLNNFSNFVQDVRAVAVSFTFHFSSTNTQTVESVFCVCYQVQTAAQNTLQNGWKVLLPTAEERTKSLIQLLPEGVSGW